MSTVKNNGTNRSDEARRHEQEWQDDQDYVDFEDPSYDFDAPEVGGSSEYPEYPSAPSYPNPGTGGPYGPGSSNPGSKNLATGGGF
ncbi:MAG: hypothetical protein K8R69_10275, partial [Deltaproteobacteria bacterium]|nr:hypothetical protein [Deltaproteobacteria bacterium]